MFIVNSIEERKEANCFKLGLKSHPIILYNLTHYAAAIWDDDLQNDKQEVQVGQEEEVNEAAVVLEVILVKKSTF